MCFACNFKNHDFEEIFFRKSRILYVKFFRKSKVLIEGNLLKSINFKGKFFVLSDFESIFFLPVSFKSIFSQLVSFLIENFTTCQILNVPLFQKFVKFSCVCQNRARFGIVLMYGMGYVDQITLLL